MLNGLVAYERGHGIDVNYKPFSLLLNNEEGEVIGVLNAYTAFAEIYIDDIWVDEAYRGQGHGRKLIEALEMQFEGEGFNNINLVTSAFQAPEFYKKCGFSVEFVRENKKNPQLTKTFFVKYFADETQTQGIFES
ncbi:GNAT family N-acetyltransferase [Candidatus Berkiella aquae]|nr:GNAT family N-acetyltransferase [Candidatus Berkiella aquae]